MIFKLILPKYEVVLLKSFLSLHNFGALKCENQIYEENKGFECIFFKLK